MLSQVINKFERFGISSHFLPNAIGLWPEEQRTLVELALQSDPNYDWIEIGSFCGGSAVLLCLARQALNAGPQVISVDIDFNPIFDHNLYHRGKFQDIHKKICVDSSLIGQLLDKPISFAFIDGFHSFSQIIKDFEQLLPKLTPDAYILFHDASPHLKEVISAEIKYDQYATIRQDFFVDEAISYICKTHGYKLIDLNIPEYTPHFSETGLTQWKHGTTSPFHAIGAIQRQ